MVRIDDLWVLQSVYEVLYWEREVRMDSSLMDWGLCFDRHEDGCRCVDHPNTKLLSLWQISRLPRGYFRVRCRKCDVLLAYGCAPPYINLHEFEEMIRNGLSRGRLSRDVGRPTNFCDGKPISRRARLRLALAKMIDE